MGWWWGLALVLTIPLAALILLASSLETDSIEIAFTAEGSLGRDIIHLDITHGLARNITHSRDLSEANPEWSADGEWLAFEAAEGRSPRWVVVQRTDGSQRLELPRANPWNEFPEWSPTALNLAYVSLDGVLHREIFHVDVLCLTGQRCDNTVRNLTRSAKGDYGFSWSPDGERMVFASWRTGTSQLFIMNQDGGNLTRLTGDDDNDVGPHWSPDGSRVAFVSDRDGNLELYTIAVADRTVHRLTNDLDIDTEPTWSPDGRQVAFVSLRGGNRDLYLMDSDGDNLRRLTQHPASDTYPRWSPDGQRIAFVSDRAGRAQIYILDLNSNATPRRLIDSNYRETWAPAWRP